MRFVRQIPAGLRLPGSAKDWERVFANLFLNAAQIMRKPGRIDIAAQETDGNLTITISDNGPGIPDEILPRVFRPHVSTKTSRSGRSGLGLHIVSSIVKKYSGRVLAANRERSNWRSFHDPSPDILMRIQIAVSSVSSRGVYEAVTARFNSDSG